MKVSEVASSVRHVYDDRVTRLDYPVQGGILSVLEGPWTQWTPPGWPHGTVRLKVSRDKKGRATITEVRIEDAAGVAAGLLRKIPLGALEDFLNGQEVSRSV